MGAGRVLLGMIFCLIAAILIVFFITLGYNLSSYPELATLGLYQAIFFLLFHPYYTISLGIYSALAALAVGAFVGGLASKGAKRGALAGLLSWIVIFVLYICLTWLFDFASMMALWSALGIGLVVDIAISLGIVVVGAIGGAITGGGED
jgi:hypothetical protein